MGKATLRLIFKVAFFIGAYFTKIIYLYGK